MKLIAIDHETDDNDKATG